MNISKVGQANEAHDGRGYSDRRNNYIINDTSRTIGDSSTRLYSP